jgi:hypothetical protein
MKMAKKRKAQVGLAIDSKWAQSVSLRFGKESGIDPPDGFEDLKVGDEVNVEITGKVTNIQHGEGSSSLDIEMSEVELESGAEEAKEEAKEPKEPKTINETLEKIQKKK